MSLDQLREPQKGDKVATIITNMGDIKIRLFPKAAPLTVDNFVRLSEEGYYNGVIFHRVIPDFMIQEEIQPEPAEAENRYTVVHLTMNLM